MAKPALQHKSVSPASAKDTGDLKALQDQYEEAIRKHNDAQTRLAELQSSNASLGAKKLINFGPKTQGIAALRQRRLQSHLETIRLQKRRDFLELLTRYADEADQIAIEEGIFDAHDSLPTAITTSGQDASQQAALTSAQQYLNALMSDAKRKTTELELLLVKARQQLKSEQILFERAEARSRSFQNGANLGRTEGPRQQALEATRDELQKWISEGLARCEQETSQLPAREVPGSLATSLERSDEDIEALIEMEYEKYLEVRLQLVHAANDLGKPLPEHGTAPSMNAGSSSRADSKAVYDDQNKKLPMQRAAHLRHKSRMSVNKFSEQVNGPSLAKIESLYLPRYHHERLLNTHLTYLEGQTSTHDARLLQGLNLLSHESHLLPSYPLPLGASTPKANTKNMTPQQCDVEDLLSAWAYASNTAEELLGTSVMGNAEETKEALDRSSQYLDEIHLMEDMKRKVMTQGEGQKTGGKP